MYDIQFEIGTNTIQIPRLNKISQTNAKIIIHLSESGENESTRMREFKKEVAMFTTASKNYGFLNNLKEKNHETANSGCRNFFLKMQNFL